MTDPRDSYGDPLPEEPALPPELNPRHPGRRVTPPAASGAAGRGHRTLRQRIGRGLSWVAVTMSVIILAVTAIGTWKFQSYVGNIQHGGPVASGDVQRPDKPAEAKDARNVLLIGSDTRDTTGAQFQGTGDEFTTGQRSDTIILAHLYGDSDAAQLVSFPRDSWVTIPAYTDTKTGKLTPAHDAKINSAISEGGPQLLVSTIESLTKIRIDDWIMIDFAGFQSMVNELGGVEVCLNKAVKEKYSGINLPAGKQTISGAQALAFVRQRHELPNGDIDRIARQQHFIGALTRKVLSAGTLLNPFKLDGFLTKATKNLTTDDGLSGVELKDLALRLRGFSAGGVAFTTVPFSDIGANRGGQSVVLLDKVKSATLFNQLRLDKPPAELAAPAPTDPSAAPAPADLGLIVAPSAIKVRVYNGAGVTGLGTKASKELAARGFSILGAPGNRGSGATGTVVRYSPTKADSARTLAASVPGATLEQDASLGSTLEIVVGSGYTGAVAVTIGAAPVTPTPTTPVAEAPLETAATAGCVN